MEEERRKGLSKNKKGPKAFRRLRQENHEWKSVRDTE
jgi:hypothetical protein